MQDAVEDTTEDVPVRDEEGALSSEFVRSVETSLESGETGDTRELAGELHEADLADLIEVLRPDDRAGLIEALGADFKASTLTELDEQVLEQVLDAMPNEQVAEVVRELDSDDAVALLEDLEAHEQTEILGYLPAFERAALMRSLEFAEDSAGRLMQTDLIAVPPFWSVGQAIDYMRESDDLPNTFSELFVVQPNFHIIGTVPLNRLLRTKRPILIEEITEKDIHPIPVDMDQEEIARQFERYDLISAPVVDNDERLVGVITVDDIVEVIQEEAEEDIHRLGGVGDEALSDNIYRIARGRFMWLLINLATAILASWVISLFDATIQQQVALAVLMPIVASMGGNAATQTMTVSVRALATRELGPVNALRVVGREVAVGLINGFMFAALLAVVTIFWFGNDTIGTIIAVAMVVNMVMAALAGILVPLALDELKIDPAVASSVFVTTVTDVVGFFAFLGLAALWLV